MHVFCRVLFQAAGAAAAVRTEESSPTHPLALETKMDREAK